MTAPPSCAPKFANLFVIRPHHARLRAREARERGRQMSAPCATARAAKRGAAQQQAPRSVSAARPTHRPLLTCKGQRLNSCALSSVLDAPRPLPRRHDPLLLSMTAANTRLAITLALYAVWLLGALLTCDPAPRRARLGASRSLATLATSPTLNPPRATTYPSARLAGLALAADAGTAADPQPALPYTSHPGPPRLAGLALFADAGVVAAPLKPTPTHKPYPGARLAGLALVGDVGVLAQAALVRQAARLAAVRDAGTVLAGVARARVPPREERVLQQLRRRRPRLRRPQTPAPRARSPPGAHLPLAAAVPPQDQAQSVSRCPRAALRSARVEAGNACAGLATVSRGRALRAIAIPVGSIARCARYKKPCTRCVPRRLRSVRASRRGAQATMPSKQPAGWTGSAIAPAAQAQLAVQVRLAALLSWLHCRVHKCRTTLASWLTGRLCCLGTWSESQTTFQAAGHAAGAGLIVPGDRADATGEADKRHLSEAPGAAT